MRKWWCIGPAMAAAVLYAIGGLIVAMLWLSLGSRAVTAQSAPVIGSHANLWNAVAVGANGTSTVMNTRGYAHCSVFGNTSGATTLTAQYSADNTNFYGGPSLGMPTGNFGTDVVAGARYMRVQSSAAVTITASMQCKP